MKIDVLEKKRKTVEEAVITEVEIELPTTHKFFKRLDDSTFFGRGLILFALIVKYSHTLLLYEIEEGTQSYVDFVPKSDCKREDFMTSRSDIRRVALEIMKGGSNFKEITEEEFLLQRGNLLNNKLSELITKKTKA